MTKADKLTNEQREIVRAQNDALLRLPKDRDDRIKLIHGYRLEKAKENDLIAQAKKDVGSSETLKRLTGSYGLKKQAVTFINVLSEMSASDRSAALRQVINHGEDEGWIIPDLFDAGAIGVGSNDAAGETAGFDRTSEGQRRGGAKAEPRTAEQMAESHAGAGPVPGVPLDEALKQLEAYREANPPKRGAKPKELKRLEAQVEASREAHNAAEGEGPADLPEAKPGEITESLREANAASEAHIRDAVDGPGAPPAEDEPAATEAAATPKRTRAKKAEPAAAAAPPPPPPVEDDEEEDEAGAAVTEVPVHRPDAIGAAPATYRAG